MTDTSAMQSSAHGNRNQQHAGDSNILVKAAGSAKQQAGRVYDGASSGVSEAWNAAQRQAASRPFVTVASAAVVGAGLAWLLPAGRRETELMSDVAHKVTDAARDAVDTAVDVGRQQVNELTDNALASVGGAVVQAVIAGGSPDGH